MMPFDELHLLEDDIQDKFIMQKLDKGKCIDDILGFLLFCYLVGNEDSNNMLSSKVPVNTKKMGESIYRKVAEKDFQQRASEYLDSGDMPSLFRVIETDGHRIYNESIIEVGNEVIEADKDAVITKKWETMLDDRVRETHDYLEGMEVPFGEEFYTFDGDHALYPGGFIDVNNNANCRCRVVLKR